jgi:hypothetical protein
MMQKFRFNKILLGGAIICALANSCIITNAITDSVTQTYGFYSGYKRLSEQQQASVVIINDTQALPTLADSTTYAITAKHLHDVIKLKSPCIIYLWDSRCSGSACISINAFKEHCATNKLNAIIVSEFFDFEMLQIQNANPRDVFAVNHWHYGTDYCIKYNKRFIKDLYKHFNQEFKERYPYKFMVYDGATLKPYDGTRELYSPKNKP